MGNVHIFSCVENGDTNKEKQKQQQDEKEDEKENGRVQMSQFQWDHTVFEQLNRRNKENERKMAHTKDKVKDKDKDKEAADTEDLNGKRLEQAIDDNNSDNKTDKNEKKQSVNEMTFCFGIKEKDGNIELKDEKTDNDMFLNCKPVCLDERDNAINNGIVNIASKNDDTDASDNADEPNSGDNETGDGNGDDDADNDSKNENDNENDNENEDDEKHSS